MIECKFMEILLYDLLILFFYRSNHIISVRNQVSGYRLLIILLGPGPYSSSNYNRFIFLKSLQPCSLNLLQTVPWQFPGFPDLSFSFSFSRIKTNYDPYLISLTSIYRTKPYEYIYIFSFNNITGTGNYKNTVSFPTI